MLKYLFTAEYKDGSIYQQNAEDRSVKEPEKRSCFFDIEHDKLVGFVLKNADRSFGVDLRDGHFEVNGVSFFPQEENEGKMYHIEKLPNGRQSAVPLENFEVVFFRRHTHKMEVSVHEDKQKEVGHDIAYRVGWKCNVKCGRKGCPQFQAGHNYEEVMQFE